MCVEQREIRRRIAEYRIGTRCYLYPGADEAGCTMLARAVNEDRGEQPRVYIRFNSCAAEQVQPLYEDRYIGESVKYMVLAAGGLPVYALADADMVLLVNCPADRMEYRIVTNRQYGVNRTPVELAEYAAYCIGRGSRRRRRLRHGELRRRGAGGFAPAEGAAFSGWRATPGGIPPTTPWGPPCPWECCTGISATDRPTGISWRCGISRTSGMTPSYGIR